MASLTIRGAAGAYLPRSIHRAIDISAGPSNGPCLAYNSSRNGKCCFRELVHLRKCISSKGHLFVCRNASAEATTSSLHGAVNRAGSDDSLPKYTVQPLVRTEFCSIKGTAVSSKGSVKATESRLILVDGKALVYRAYYRISSKIFHGSLKKMSTGDSSDNSSWDSTMTTIVALTEILNLLELQPSHVAVVFDFQGATFRHNLFPQYKSNRLATPDTVRQAERDTKHAVLAMGLKVLEVPGVEADDVIGTLSIQAVEAGMKVRVVSQDKDFFQLLSPQLRLLRFRQKGPGFESFGVEEFKEKFPDLEVSQFVDLHAIVGDPVDNIPGVRGIGDIIGMKLIQEFGTLETLLQERDKITEARARKSLLNDTGEARLSKQLVTLRLDVPTFAMGCTLQNLNCQLPQDGGKGYLRLINAFGAIVGQTIGIDLIGRTRNYWRKLSSQD